MSTPQNANDVTRTLLELSRELDETTKELNEKDLEATRLEEDLNYEESKAFVAAQGAEGFRKANSRIQTHDLRMQARLAAAEVRGLQRRVRTLERRIDVGRTYGATIREEAKLAGYGGGA